ncbi:hypothetical protein ACSFBF_13990 [Variovorax sp. ZT5P49]|uniref:hypothetical protein n=1 Tax=Variovorax sp. ZT5P49 TaxID=3443733 RepID=UPI003F4903DB
MAKRIMARPHTPASPDATATTATGPGPSDLLENKLEQLRSLLWCLHGDGRWGEQEDSEHLNNVLWLAAELAREAAALFQESARF